MQQLLLVNPSRRRRRGGKKRSRSASGRRRRRHSVSAAPRRRRSLSRVVRRVSRRRRSNPISLRGVPSMLMPAFKGAAGAVAVDVAYRMLPLPGSLAFLKAGMLAPVTKIAVAVGVGALASMFGGRSLGREMTSGALVVIGYGLINDLLLSRLPVLGAPAAVSGMGEYISGNVGSLGYAGPGTVVNGLSEYISGAGMGGGFDDFEAF